MTTNNAFLTFKMSAFLVHPMTLRRSSLSEGLLELLTSICQTLFHSPSPDLARTVQITVCRMSVGIGVLSGAENGMDFK